MEKRSPAIRSPGSIHLTNIMSSPRTHLKYVVEADPKKLRAVGDEWRFSKDQLLTPDQDEIVFKDPRLVLEVAVDASDKTQECFQNDSWRTFTYFLVNDFMRALKTLRFFPVTI